MENKAIAKGEQLFDALTQTTLSKAKKTGLPIFHFTEKEQVGSNFGERFTNAIASVFAQGFDNIITIGNDTPHLRSQHLKRAAYQLSLGKTVIGPSADGGFYLLGLQKTNFDNAAFKNLPWQRFSLFGQISSWLLNESTELIKLPVLHDLDNEKDLKFVLNFSRSLTLYIRRLLTGILGYKHALFFNVKVFPVLFLNRSMYNKGSPKGIFA